MSHVGIESLRVNLEMYFLNVFSFAQANFSVKMFT